MRHNARSLGHSSCAASMATPGLLISVSMNATAAAVGVGTTGVVVLWT